ncbi:MAG: UDP-N-acetylmuramoyl-tripeptide--D-alanyl-D-alanine ligase [Deltaproteobacteria bacterium]|nr:UDP-N-acetylmuramoyl-tripeptide--D-alanyl-D-alanine ligase [Deltaproteobacteria bacterium]
MTAARGIRGPVRALEGPSGLPGLPCPQGLPGVSGPPGLPGLPASAGAAGVPDPAAGAGGFPRLAASGPAGGRGGSFGGSGSGFPSPGLASLGLTLPQAMAEAGIPVPPALAEAASRGEAPPFSGVSTDTRTLAPGDLFVALSGPRFDGESFLEAAFAKGAAAAVAAQGPGRGLSEAARARTARVPDSLRSLGDLARRARVASGALVAAVTGSVGKTTVKDLLGLILEEGIGKTLVTQGNFNNRVGVPWTLFRLEAGTRAAAVELGASEFGEIAELARICLPDIALVTRIDRAHLESFGDLAGVARAKGELFRNLKEGAAAAVNLGDPLIRAMGEELRRDKAFRGKILSFGPEGSGADLILAGSSPLPGGGARLSLRGSVFGKGRDLDSPLPGAHNVWNALCALAAGACAGVGPEAAARALARAALPAGRGAELTAGGLRILDSSYNSSPGAVSAELRRLSSLPGPRGALLGDMLELGPEGPALHRAAGREAAGLGLDYLALTGELSLSALEGALDAGLPRSRARHFASPLEAAEWARAVSGGKGTLLVKGSHATGVWKAVGLLAPEAAFKG